MSDIAQQARQLVEWQKLIKEKVDANQRDNERNIYLDEKEAVVWDYILAALDERDSYRQALERVAELRGGYTGGALRIAREALNE